MKTTDIVFAAGVITILVALGSPLDGLADHHMLTAHMVQHLLLCLVAAPLLWLGSPTERVRGLLRAPLAGPAGRYLLRPRVAWVFAVGTMWLWHWPRLHGLSMRHPELQLAQHLCFLLSGIAFWGPILSRAPELLLPPVAAIFYLFGACLADTLLGILITFAAPGAYPAYAGGWLSAEVDQQAGGLMMWVPCCLVYVSAVMWVLARWYQEEEHGA